MFKSVDTILDLAKSGYKPIATAKPRHFAAIGNFIVTIGTEIDARLKSALHSQIMSDELTFARALIGDMRTGEVISALRRIAESRSPPEDFISEMNQLFGEISALRHERNALAHQTGLVLGNKLAFHNATYARSDAAIEVNTYTLSEISELTDYAKRIGFRLLEWLGRFPTAQVVSANKRAYLTAQLYLAVLKAVVALTKSGTLSKEKIGLLKAASGTARRALDDYIDVAKKIDTNFEALQQKAAAAVTAFVNALLLVQAPNSTTLRKIPARLQKPNKTSSVGTSRSRKRQRKASQK